MTNGNATGRKCDHRTAARGAASAAWAKARYWMAMTLDANERPRPAGPIARLDPHMWRDIGITRLGFSEAALDARNERANAEAISGVRAGRLR